MVLEHSLLERAVTYQLALLHPRVPRTHPPLLLSSLGLILSLALLFRLRILLRVTVLSFLRCRLLRLILLRLLSLHYALPILSTVARSVLLLSPTLPLRVLLLRLDL